MLDPCLSLLEKRKRKKEKTPPLAFLAKMSQSCLGFLSTKDCKLTESEVEAFRSTAPIVEETKLLIHFMLKHWIQRNLQTCDQGVLQFTIKGLSVLMNITYDKDPCLNRYSVYFVYLLDNDQGNREGKREIGLSARRRHAIC